jgi:DMSO reductase anchor subunit
MIEISIKLFVPFLVVLVYKAILKNKMKMNLSYWMISTVIAIYLQIYHIPTIETWNHILTVFYFSFIVSTAIIGAWILTNILFYKFVLNR